MTTYFVPHEAFNGSLAAKPRCARSWRGSARQGSTPVVAIEGIGGWARPRSLRKSPGATSRSVSICPQRRASTSSSGQPQGRRAAPMTPVARVPRSRLSTTSSARSPRRLRSLPSCRYLLTSGPKQCWAALHMYRRVLLVVDNLEEDADDSIRGFLRDLPDGVKALVTTRFHENLPRPFRLGPLQFPAARELVVAECSSRGLMPAQNDLDTLARVSQGMPLAARLVVGLCATNGIESVTRPQSDAHVSSRPRFSLAAWRRWSSSSPKHISVCWRSRSSIRRLAPQERRSRPASASISPPRARRARVLSISISSNPRMSLLAWRQ